MGYRNVLVAVDGSEMSKRAVERAVGLARAERARLVMLGVDEAAPPFIESGGEAWRDGQVYAAVEAAVGAARQAGVSAEGIVVDGYPAEVIVRYSTELECDLVVVGAPDPREASHGDTADKVTDLATCSVLVTR
jgi:nucleotide-binding universal stress UspA family protein